MRNLQVKYELLKISTWYADFTAYQKVKPNLTWRIMDVCPSSLHCLRHGQVDIADNKSPQSTGSKTLTLLFSTLPALQLSI